MMIFSSACRSSTRTRERVEEPTAETIEKALMQMWAGDPEDFMDIVRGMRTYEDAEIMTTDNGVVITTADGSQFQLTIVQSRMGW